MRWIEHHRPWLAVALLAAVAFFTHPWEGDLHGDTVRYAAISKNIVKTGEWITLYDAPGIVYGNKPPLMFWLVALNFKLFGFGMYAAKFWSAFFGVAACVATFLLGRRLFGPTVGLLAGAMEATFIGVIPNASTVRLDSATVFHVVLGFYATVRAIQDERPRWLLLAGLAAGLSLMTRPVGALFIVLGLALLLAFRRPRWLLHPCAMGVVPLAAVIALPWHLAVIAQEGQAFTKHYFGTQVREHMIPSAHVLANMADNAGDLFALTLPWVPLAFYGLFRWRRAPPADRTGFWTLTVWIVGIFLLVAIPVKSYGRHLLAACPAVAMLAAYGLAALLPERWHGRLPGFIVKTAVVLGLAFALLPVPLHAYRASAYQTARPLLDRLAPGEPLASYDPTIPSGGRNWKQWALRAATVFYLDRALTNYSTRDELRQAKPAVLVANAVHQDELRNAGYELLMPLDRVNVLLWRREAGQ